MSIKINLIPPLEFAVGLQDSGFEQYTKCRPEDNSYVQNMESKMGE